ncbi:MAG TPA: class I tRNA ligase family protein, partial [Steroidobacteraceae bacterium]|nr:class I tRNA ligase family protein [Steroidobacteraceae bacterium]
KDRPDWCLSRQRTWGVPITLFVHKQTQELHPRTQELIEAVANRIEKDGVEAWFDLEPRELLGADADAYEKVTDVMDVWADSGLSFECVHHTHPDEVKSPVDIYLEGSDQHRGWFHSSLLMSEALYERAPYKSVLTHGFTVDEKGIKMSKSLGNVIEPKKVMATSGADVLRLWIAGTDYANEMSLSDEILKCVGESYRRMRNTVRFLLGNMAGFDPAKDQVSPDQLVALDRWALWRTEQLQEEVVAAYRNYQFHLVYQKVHNFCSVDLGGFYLDVLKDRLYTTPAKSHARRSAQTAMFWIAEAMVRWLAPILSFTAEEIWRLMPGERNESVLLNTWVALPQGAAQRPQIDWDTVLRVRSGVMRELEKLRNANSIGAPLDAAVDVYCAPHVLQVLQPFGEELRFAFITSAARVHRADSRPAEATPAEEGNEDLAWVVARPSAAKKCVRCWHKREDVGGSAEHPELCGRCVSNVTGSGEQRRYI